ncbi:N4-gp56 family major capsid protein [Enterococcus faecium]|uniref:N4-gp56 family major capsid protein n=2 Tax=Enterococcus faecium TaxID=1352 RepID=A0AB74CVG3_ENTFC|nr:N4-gp56 family major capsid protein [Enterococcus faecium]EGP4987424.1 N4-gp56 family major capsid protein [Enterococcus faecium]EGP5257280.1 N4-gp56 family major capsid protein [Enterococcus faecium]EME7081403.1 N4-gp56 family major capsid protein [Enterococcus faecium]EMF0336079.1 N4-gp56 family major capsid protein [Enterococcus faecium]ROX49227.1 N4-gp56 family major capsid protein [Enterococcus faecium]
MMADETTLLANLVDPEVLAPMISAQLPKAIKFSGIAPIDTTLTGQPGSTITVPKFKYIGDAVDVAEGAKIDYTKLTIETAQYTIKKAAKGVQITDEAALSGYGDPVGEAQKQIRMSIASKVDNDILVAAQTATLEVQAEINLDLIDTLENTFVDAPDNFEDVDSTGVLFLSYKDAAKLRKEAATAWTRASELGDNILVSGAFGEVLGWEIVRTQKLTEGNGIAVKSGALKTFMKRSILAESARDIDHKLTKFNADQHYSVALVDESRVVKISPKA